MIQNFIFRSAVRGAALWDLKKKLSERTVPEKRLLVTYDNGRKIKVVLK